MDRKEIERRAGGVFCTRLPRPPLKLPSQPPLRGWGKGFGEGIVSGRRPLAPSPKEPCRPARLVFLLEELKFGGTQRQALALARRLDPDRFQVEIWSLAGGNDLAPVAAEWRIPVVWLGRGDWVGPANFGKFWLRLKRAQADLLVLFTALPNIWGRVLGCLAGAPLIVGNIRGNTPYRQHERWLWPLADHLVCNNEAVRTRLTKSYRIPPARLSLIYNGVDTNFFRPGALAQTGGRLKVLSVARMVPDKDHATLVRAFQLVSGAHPGAELWMVGEGPRKSAIEGLAARLLLPGRVRFLPGQADLRPLFQEADLLVLSSVTEALPNVVLEAMACGLPVVATRVGGLPELVVSGETGWLAPPRNPAALAGAIGQLLGDPDTRRTFGRAGRERVVKEFALEAMVRRHEDLFTRLLHHTGPGVRPADGGR